jgi:hypothetical protein
VVSHDFVAIWQRLQQFVSAAHDALMESGVVRQGQKRCARLRVLRAEREWSQARLAARVGVTPDYRLLVRLGHPYYSVSPSASELGGQQCCEKVHWPMHDDHPRETTRPQIDELKDYDQWQKLQETKYD